MTGIYNIKTMKETDGNDMERKVRKALKINEFQEDWEVIPRNYGYELKLYGAMACESENIAWTLKKVIGYGNFEIRARKKYESIKMKF